MSWTSLLISQLSLMLPTDLGRVRLVECRTCSIKEAIPLGSSRIVCTRIQQKLYHTSSRLRISVRNSFVALLPLLLSRIPFSSVGMCAYAANER